MTIICVVLVQTCTKAYFKAKRMDEQKKEWRRISSNETGDRAIKRMGKTSDIDEKLTILKRAPRRTRQSSPSPPARYTS